VLFESGQAPFIITGPWAVDRFKTNEVPYAISVFPAAEEDGEPGAPLVGVQGFMVNANSENLLLAQTYLTEFIATEEAQQYIFDGDPRPSAWLSIFEATEDEDMKGFAEAGANGQAMPVIPAMGYVWDAWTNAGLLIAQGDLTPSEALADAAEQIVPRSKKAASNWELVDISSDPSPWGVRLESPYRPSTAVQNRCLSSLQNALKAFGFALLNPFSGFAITGSALGFEPNAVRRR